MAGLHKKDEQLSTKTAFSPPDYGSRRQKRCTFNNIGEQAAT
jgi:hypothetical protein